jgi:hypothetical protein
VTKKETGGNRKKRMKDGKGKRTEQRIKIKEMINKEKNCLRIPFSLFM